MTQVVQLVVEQPSLRHARSMMLAIIDLAKNRDLTPEQYRAHFNAIDMLAREAHDLIVNAEFEQEGGGSANGNTQRGHTPTQI
ncbi:hypothetical protein [Pantoea sp.]|uniref:hypothetical protein n=1 Tax=Pantoea sp. TaxID=69393 RepID=UPI0031E06C2C